MRRLLLFLFSVTLLATGASAGAQAVASRTEARGLAQPDGETWGDEWYDDEARTRASELERRMIEEAGGEPVLRGADDAQDAAESAAPVVVVEGRRTLESPSHGFADLLELWRSRREALLRQDEATAAAQEKRLRQLLDELDVPEVHAFAAATLRESRKFGASAPREALDRAELAVALAPSLPAAHLQLLRARFAVDPADVESWGRAAIGAVRAATENPRYLRSIAVDLATALAAALLATALVVFGIFTVRHGATALHDFHDRFPRGATRLQTTLLACICLALPPALGLGPLSLLLLLAAGLWLYLDLGERIAVGICLIAVGLLPLGAGWVAERASWDGTPAEALYAIETAGDFSPLPELEEIAARDDTPPETLFVVARAKKRLGALREAEALYERVLEERPRWPEAAVNLGNLRFLQGDLGGAEKLYTQAIDHDPGLAAAYFNLSRVHYDRVDFTLGQAAREKALELRPTLVSRYAAGDGARAAANQYLVDARLPRARLSEMAVRPEAGKRVETQLSGMSLGRVPAVAAPWVPAAFVLLLVIGGAFATRFRPAQACSKCGRPVCASCDPETVGASGLCGQCLNVFARKAVVDPAAKVQKEIAVRRYQARRALAARAASFLFAGPLVAGRIFTGLAILLGGLFLAALAWQGSGAIKPRYEGWPVSWKLALIAVPFVVLLVLSLRDGRKGA